MAVELRILKTVDFGNAKRGRCFLCQKPHSECGGPFLSTGVSADGDEEFGADMVVIGQKCWKRMAKKMGYVEESALDGAMQYIADLETELAEGMVELSTLHGLIRRIELIKESFDVEE